MVLFGILLWGVCFWVCCFGFLGVCVIVFYRLRLGFGFCFFVWGCSVFCFFCVVCLTCGFGFSCFVLGYFSDVSFLLFGGLFLALCVPLASGFGCLFFGVLV